MLKPHHGVLEGTKLGNATSELVCPDIAFSRTVPKGLMLTTSSLIHKLHGAEAGAREPEVEIVVATLADPKKELRKDLRPL